jgi:Na+/H+-dicarboxylate symporter
MAAGVGLGAALAPLPPEHRGRTAALAVATASGELFVRLITMVMVPLVVASITVGMISLGDPRRLGRIGAKALAYFGATTAVAVGIGLSVANLIRPGDRLPEAQAAALRAAHASGAGERARAAQQVTESGWGPLDLLTGLVPRNAVRAMADADMLAVIGFSVLLGLGILLVPRERTRALVEALEGFNEVMLKLVEVVMTTAPFGVMGLMAKLVLTSGAGVLLPLAGYGLTVLLGLAVHMTLVYPLTVRLWAGLSPATFLGALREVHLTAFSTSSSAATLAVNLGALERSLGVPPRIAGFVLPLGATVNMDGTALYQGVATLFIAQVYGIDLTPGAQASVVVTATLASIGSAPVPGAGMVMLALILTPLGIPVEGLALIMGLDRLLDMCRTVVNVTGDAACAVVVAATEGERLAVAQGSNR